MIQHGIKLKILQQKGLEFSFDSIKELAKERARNNLSILYPLTPTLSRRERELVVEVISCAFLSIF